MKAADRKSSRPEGWLPAGAKVPLRLTIKQIGNAVPVNLAAALVKATLVP